MRAQFLPCLCWPANANSQARIIRRSQVLLNRAQPVVTAGATIDSQSHLAKIDVGIIHNDHHPGCLDSIIIDYRPHGFATEVHERQRFAQMDGCLIHHGPTHPGFKFFLIAPVGVPKGR